MFFVIIKPIGKYSVYAALPIAWNGIKKPWYLDVQAIGKRPDQANECGIFPARDDSATRV